MAINKIINDPVYGFITIPTPFIHELIQHPYVQRLRRINQLALTQYVYPGALHSRFHHALGAMHLMISAVNVLRQKGVKITDTEAEALYAGILLHDIGHGPFSHTLEHTLSTNVNHEFISILFMQKLNDEYKGKLDLTIQIFQNKYKKKFLYQLISGQMDMDRLDYLARDSFFTGVIEGMVGSDRIISMLNVVNDELVIEEKGIYSIEKFIIARRLMYWQVYLHKTVVATDVLLTSIIKRAAYLIQNNHTLFASPSLIYFLKQKVTKKIFLSSDEGLKHFASLDDADVFSAIKQWQHYNDTTLATLSRHLIERHLPKMIVQTKTFSKNQITTKQKEAAKLFNIPLDEAIYFASEHLIKNEAYKDESTRINILKKNGEVVDVTDASDNYNLKVLKKPVKKYYLSYYRK